MNWRKGDHLKNSRTGDRGTIARINGQSVHVHHRDAPGISVGTQERLEQAGWELAEE